MGGLCDINCKYNVYVYIDITSLLYNVHVQSNLYSEVMTFETTKKWPYKTGDLLKEVQLHMDFYMTCQEVDILMKVTA